MNVKTWFAVAGSVVALVASGNDSLRVGAAQQPAGDRPTYRSDDFVERVCLAYTPGEKDGPSKFWEYFRELGIRYYRTSVWWAYTQPNQPEICERIWREHGMRPMLLIDAGWVSCLADGKGRQDGDFTWLISQFKRYRKGLIAFVEGPNEINNKFGQDLNLKYKGLTDEAAGSVFMRDLRAAMKADPETAELPLVMHNCIFTDYSLAGGCDAFDYLNMHCYQGDDVPSSSLLMNMSRAWNVLPSGAATKPFFPTECGYNVETDKTNGQGYTGSLRAQALNVPMLLAEYYRHGIRRYSVYNLSNSDGYGFVEDDAVTRRPVYFAVKSLLGLMNDSKWNSQTLSREGGAGFVPQVLRFTLEGAPETVHTLSFQKANGDWMLLVWNELRNGRGRQDIVNPDVPVTVRFADGFDVSCTGHWRQSGLPADGAFLPNAEPKVSGGKVTLAVPSGVAVYRFASSGRKAGAAPATPGLKAAGAPAENLVKLAVTMPKGEFASVMIFRDEWHIGTIPRAAFPKAGGTVTFTDDSAWLRPGLGYHYRAMAVTASGALGKSGKALVTTADRRADVAVRSLDVPETARVGEKVALRATAVNAGPGSTAQRAYGNNGIYDTSISAVFSVDGQTVGWGGYPGTTPLAPGATFDAGAEWTAVAGTHVVRLVLDDVNRIPAELNEWNNSAMRTITVGDYAGKLSVASGAAEPFVRLAAEGTLDWVCFDAWGEGAKPTRKPGADMIGLPRQIGQGFIAVNPGCAIRQELGEGQYSNGGIWGNCTGNGYEFEVPADAQERELKVYVGVTEGGCGAFSAELTDGSAPAVKDVTWDANRSFVWSPVPGEMKICHTVRFKSPNPGAKLKVRWALVGEPNGFRAQIRLQSASLRSL